MKALRTGFSLLLPAIAMLAIPPAASGEYLVPPGNSAATQYTEAYPTAGGSRNAEGNGKEQSSSPAEALGERNARKLASQGPEGQAAAEVAAATAPRSSVTSSPDAGADDKRANGDGEAAGTPEQPAAGGAATEGSSGVGEVLAHATGSSSSGGIGLLLPLAIAGAIAWALAYLWRQRKRQTA